MTLVSTHRAILFADIADSTTIYERLGDRVAAQTIDRYLAVLRHCVQAAGGHVVKNIGDEVMAAFPTADAACAASIAMQESASRLPPANGLICDVRIGFHFGAVLEDGGDFWGDGVNTASRLASLARRGQILTAETTVLALNDALRQRTRDLDAYSLKGKTESVRVFEVQWVDDLDATHVVPPTPVVSSCELMVRLRDRTVEWKGDGVFWMGRGADCHMVVAEKTASRRHARIEHRQGQYFLIDESTNGTYLGIDGEADAFIRREQVPLRGRGRIALGTALASATDPLVFECAPPATRQI